MLDICCSSEYIEISLNYRLRLHVYLGCCVPMENFSLIWKGHHYLLRAATFYIYLALMNIERATLTIT